MKFAELSAKSCFSFLYGASHPEEMIQRAHSLGYAALGLTDFHGFYGMVRAYEKAKELNFPFLVGTEIEIENARLTFLAKNLSGYRKLCRLISSGFENSSEKGKPVFRRHGIENWLSSEDLHLLLPPRDFPSQNLLKWLCEHMRPTQLVTLTGHPDRDQPLKEWLKEIPEDWPRAWTWDPVFHEPSRYELFEVLHAIRSRTPLTKCWPSPNGENYLKPLSALESFCVPPLWIKTGLEIAESCTFSPREIRYHYPHEWLPEGKTSHEFLKELCEEGLTKRFPGGASVEVYQQLQHELTLVQELQFEDYFLTVWDIVKFARSRGILCQGRGSAANSVICYLLEITSIDPIRMNLLFERFISRERNEAPDIDVDFEHERREEVIQYLYQKYGRHRAGMVATLITYRTKSALRDVGKALEIDPALIEKNSKRARWRENIWESSLQSPQEERWLRLAKLLKGFPRHLGQHTGGMILTQDALHEISPIEPARMENRTVVQWDKYDVEKLGLLKIDILSLGMLTCIRKSFDLLREHKKISLELHTIPANDQKTFEMIGRSQTVGVFQIESRAQMSMLPRLHPKTFYDLVIEVAIVRPGPIQGGMVHPYLRRRAGLEDVRYAHPKLKPILEKTLGVPIFQEQVMKMAIEVAGYSSGEADALRRAMGAWKRRGSLEVYAADIQKRLMQQGVPADFSKKICEQILGFGEYGFPESHAASFALLTYASAYLKAHHPEVFLCALLNSLPMGFYSFFSLTSSYQKEGVKILPVDSAVSTWDHRLEGEAVRLGFRCIRGMNQDHVEKFIQRRSQGLCDYLELHVDERAALAMAEASPSRRDNYWKALIPDKRPLLENTKKNASFAALDPLSSMLLDFEFTSTTLQKHPALLFKETRWHYAFPRSKLKLSRDLPFMKDRSPVTVFGVLQVIQSPPTAKGVTFITLEDETGFLNLILHPATFQKFKHLVQDEWMLLVSGRLQMNGHHSSILVSQIHPSHHQAKLTSLPSRTTPAVQTPKALEPRLFNGW